MIIRTKRFNMKIYVAGHRGLIGSAIVRMLIADGVNPEDIITRTHNQLDLTNQQEVINFLDRKSTRLNSSH